MNLDEFSFFNRQLAAMMRDGIPLEGALRKLCTSMKGGHLRRELQRLESELEKGTPFNDAIASCDLPELYLRMVQAGRKTNNLPGALTAVADHYHRTYTVWTRVKGLIVYPILVLIAAFAVSLLLTSLVTPLIGSSYTPFIELMSFGSGAPPVELLPIQIAVVTPCILLGLTLLAVCLIGVVPALRRKLVWRLPAFKEANLARFASSMEVSLKGGCTLPEALATARGMEEGSPLGNDLRRWEQQLASGATRLRQISVGSRWVPPLFVWLVDSSGDAWVDGFGHAREIYGARATARTDMLLQAALPVAILALAGMIIMQLAPLIRALAALLNNL